MKSNFLLVLACSLFLILLGCKQINEKNSAPFSASANSVKYAKGLEIYKYDGYSILKITKPWPEATAGFTYILKEKNGIIPDSLKQFTVISVPIQSIVVTSTTHIPSLEMLNVETVMQAEAGRPPSFSA